MAISSTAALLWVLWREVVEAFDEGKRRIARLGLCLEPAASKKLALERGEEALAHGIVVCVTDRTHRGAHAGVTAAVAELDRAVLRTLVGVMNDRSGPSRRQRHVQGIEHQLFGECRGHRPADAFAANLNALGRQFGMDARRTVDTA